MKNANHNMENLTLYTVTKSSSDGNIVEGDMVWLSEDGDLNSVREAGWLSEEEWVPEKTSDFEFKECETHYVEWDGRHERIRAK